MPKEKSSTKERKTCFFLWRWSKQARCHKGKGWQRGRGGFKILDPLRFVSICPVTQSAPSVVLTWWFCLCAATLSHAFQDIRLFTSWRKTIVIVGLLLEGRFKFYCAVYFSKLCTTTTKNVFTEQQNIISESQLIWIRVRRVGLVGLVLFGSFLEMRGKHHKRGYYFIICIAAEKGMWC